jgi:hypothetical protein
MIVDLYGKEIKRMTQPTTDLRFDLAAKRGDVREAMGWSFVHRLEKLVDELLAKPECPSVFWVVYSAKWAQKERKIKEFWQVTDQKPNIMMGQIIYEVDKSGKAEFWTMPLDVPVPDEELSDEFVSENVYIPDAPLSDQTFEKL